jgi:hypothetical protein
VSPPSLSAYTFPPGTGKTKGGGRKEEENDKLQERALGSAAQYKNQKGPEGWGVATGIGVSGDREEGERLAHGCMMRREG